MKIIKTITHKLIQASLLVVTGFNFSFATEPKAIIESYANPSESHYKKSGNVLAYKNCVGQTIVLKSGDYFSKQNPEIEKSPDVIVVPLEDIVALVGSIDESGKIDFSPNIFEKYNPIEKKLSVEKEFSEASIILTPSENEIKNYINLATEATSEDWQKQFIDHQADRLKTPIASLENAKKAVLNDCPKNIQNLDQLRHTEFQIHTILNSFHSVLKTYKLEKKDLIEKEGELDDVIKYAKILRLLLPASFALDMQLSSPVYSFFEACNSCKLVPWLTMNKNFFMFKVLDAQVLKYGKAVLANFHSQTAAEELQKAIDASKRSSVCFNLLSLYKIGKNKITQNVYWHYCSFCCRDPRENCRFCKAGQCNGTGHCNFWFQKRQKCLDIYTFKKDFTKDYYKPYSEHWTLELTITEGIKEIVKELAGVNSIHPSQYYFE
ncbi:MAG: hypothetical protein ACLRFH_04440 [Opitutales bacterium]